MKNVYPNRGVFSFFGKKKFSFLGNFSQSGSFCRFDQKCPTAIGDVVEKVDFDPFLVVQWLLVINIVLTWQCPRSTEQQWLPLVVPSKEHRFKKD